MAGLVRRPDVGPPDGGVGQDSLLQVLLHVANVIFQILESLHEVFELPVIVVPVQSVGSAEEILPLRRSRRAARKGRGP